MKRLLMAFVLFSLFILLLAACDSDRADGSETASGEPIGNVTTSDATTASKTEYTVSFDSLGGSDVASKNVESGAKVFKPADPTRPGYLFGGWLFQGKAWNFTSDKVNQDLTLQASWKPIFTRSGGTITKITMDGLLLETINIPAEIDGVRITRIGKEAFRGAEGAGRRQGSGRTGGTSGTGTAGCTAGTGRAGGRRMTLRSLH